MDLRELFPGIYLLDGKLATANLVKGKRVYNEDLVDIDGTEYRLWNPYRSKLSAAILNGIKNVKIEKDGSVLYLGAATGTTVSHVSDIVGRNGRVYALELSERNVRNLIVVCEARKNVLPLLADARYTEKYGGDLEECDVIYQDISAKKQAEILLANSEFLKKGGYAYFVIKSQSVDISKDPKEVYKGELEMLKGKFELVESVSLEPYDSMHLFAVLKKI
jgi:fibrillarin-like pre-rRNA processing protein